MNETERLTAVRGALVITTNSPGWQYVKALANKTVQKSIQSALDEEDGTKRDAKTLKASALQKGFSELFQAVEAVVAYKPDEAEDDAGFGDLEQELAAIERQYHKEDNQWA